MSCITQNSNFSQYEEKPDLQKCRLLHTLELNNLKSVIFTQKCHQEDKILDNVKEYLHSSIIQDGKLNRSYIIKNGKFQADKDVNINKLPAGLRNYLFEDYEFWETRNLDIFITMMLGKSYYKLPMINSENYLRRITGVSDKDINRIITEDGIIESNDKRAVELSKEINEIKYSLFEDLPEEFSHIEFTPTNYNEESINLLDVIQILKRDDVFKTIIGACGKDNIVGFTKNGFGMKKRSNGDLILKGLFGSKFWTENKEQINYNQLEENHSQGRGFKPDDGYKSVKEEFEKEHFIVTDPLFFCKITKNDRGKKRVVTYSKSDFRDIVRPITFMEQTDKGPKKMEFLSRWIQDPERRQYEKFDFIPDKNFESDKVFNLFFGFDFDDYESKPFKENKDVLQIFIEVVGNLTNNNPEQTEWLMNYLSHIIQKPNELTGIICLMKSIEGIGKDLIFNIMGKLCGQGFKFDTSDLDKAFGTFNGQMERMLMMICNETKAKKGFENAENLKAHATNEYTTINKKNKCDYTVKNFSRVFIFSNHENPVDIQATDRRYVVFQGIKERPSEEFFKPLWDLVNNNTRETRNGLYTIYKYLDTRDISKFSVRNRPITEEYTQMKNRNVNPLYEFMYDVIVDGELNTYFRKGTYDEHKTTKNIRVATTPILDAFKKWCRKNGYKGGDELHAKRLKTLFNTIDIHMKSHKINGKPVKAYEMKLTELEIKLKKMIVREEYEDDSDEWEVGGGYDEEQELYE